MGRRAARAVRAAARCTAARDGRQTPDRQADRRPDRRAHRAAAQGGLRGRPGRDAAERPRRPASQRCAEAHRLSRQGRRHPDQEQHLAPQRRPAAQHRAARRLSGGLGRGLHPDRRRDRAHAAAGRRRPGRQARAGQPERPGRAGRPDCDRARRQVRRQTVRRQSQRRQLRLPGQRPVPLRLRRPADQSPHHRRRDLGQRQRDRDRHLGGLARLLRAARLRRAARGGELQPFAILAGGGQHLGQRRHRPAGLQLSVDTRARRQLGGVGGRRLHPQPAERRRHPRLSTA